jgi:photosystem II stability/assembly factor-like uncharacterized protein
MTWIVPTLHLGEPKAPAGQVRPVPLPPRIVPSAYEFATMSVGWAVVARPTETIVFKTTDGGKNWRQSGRLAAGFGATMQFLDTTHGFLLTGNPQHLYRTTDGGAHWTELAIPDERTSGISFTDRRRGSSLNGLRIAYTTDDGGDTWRRLPDSPEDSYGPVFRNSEAWLSTRASASSALHVYWSYDRGLTWAPVDVPRPPARESTGPILSNAQVTLLPGAGVAVLVSVGPSCGKPAPCAAPDEAQYVSFDRGKTWTAVPPPRPEISYRDIVYQDAMHWWAIGSGSLFKSSNSGQTWEYISSIQQPQEWIVLHVIDAQHAWVQISTFQTRAGGSFRVSAVAVTTDGGLSWTRVLPPQVS